MNISDRIKCEEICMNVIYDQLGLNTFLISYLKLLEEVNDLKQRIVKLENNNIGE